MKGDHSPLEQEAGGEAVHRDGEEALCLWGVDVHGDDLLGPRNLQHTSYQLQQQPVTSRAGQGETVKPTYCTKTRETHCIQSARQTSDVEISCLGRDGFPAVRQLVVPPGVREEGEDGGDPAGPGQLAGLHSGCSV